MYTPISFKLATLQNYSLRAKDGIVRILESPNSSTVADNSTLDAPFKHSGTINLEANAGTTTGYVRLAINLTFPRQDAEYINYYVKGASFKITTPTIPITNSSTTPIFNGSSTGSSESGSNKISTGALIGGILGAAAVVAFIMISFVYIWKRTNKQAKYGDTTMVEAMAEAGPYTAARLPPSPTPFTIDNYGYTDNRPDLVIPVINNNNSRTFSEPRSISPDQTSTSAITDTVSLGPTIDRPPAYNDSRSPRTQHVVRKLLLVNVIGTELRTE
ncbi:hypothetical protein FRC14_005722 [Serendipita sp. 396]|nr:hypothetical protein FRC14_005722 [Serendipita sp. 396]KAG8797017.1 hypothetical protein FRC16_009293 [Serendipita sp. 398]